MAACSDIDHSESAHGSVMVSAQLRALYKAYMHAPSVPDVITPTLEQGVEPPAALHQDPPIPSPPPAHPSPEAIPVELSFAPLSLRRDGLRPIRLEKGLMALDWRSEGTPAFYHGLRLYISQDRQVALTLERIDTYGPEPVMAFAHSALLSGFEEGVRLFELYLTNPQLALSTPSDISLDAIARDLRALLVQALSPRVIEALDPVFSRGQKKE